MDLMDRKTSFELHKLTSTLREEDLPAGTEKVLEPKEAQQHLGLRVVGVLAKSKSVVVYLRGHEGPQYFAVYVHQQRPFIQVASDQLNPAISVYLAPRG